MSTPGGTDPRIAALEDELQRVKRREAEYRVKMVKEFLDRGERNTFLHILQHERAALIRREQEASADLEILTRKLEDAEARIASLEAEIKAAAAPKPRWGKPVAKPIAAPEVAPRPMVPGAPFTYYLHTSPFRIYRDQAFTLRGWAWSEDGRPMTAVRVDLDGKLYPGRIGIDEPEVVARYGARAQSPKPGFEITFETPAGRHAFSLEAQLAGEEWRSVMRTTIWCDPRAR
jgi:uncharacterized small protein (DUF1192 family)